VRTAALRSSGVAARATLGAIKAMMMAMFRISIIINSDKCRPRSMSTAIIASVRAIAQAHAAFSSAAFCTVLFADSGIEGQGGDRQSNEIKQCG
jgi:hypothetical protein